MSERGYTGLWGLKAGDAILELADFLSWDKSDWADFEKYLDELEKPKKLKRKGDSRPRIRDRLRKLRDRGALETKKVGDRVMVRLSNEAWLCANTLAIRRITMLQPGGVCLVIYDIPEDHRDERDAFRLFLKRAGFKLMQKSVWVNKHDVAMPVAAVVKELKIEAWVTVAVGKVVI